MPALIKTLAYLGVVLLVGAGLFRYGVGPELLGPRMRCRLWQGVLLGAALVISASLGDVAWSIAAILGRFDSALTRDYLLSSNHGRATLVRMGLTLLLAALTVSKRSYGTVLLTAVSVGVLATFSYLSHGTAARVVSAAHRPRALHRRHALGRGGALHRALACLARPSSAR